MQSILVLRLFKSSVIVQRLESWAMTLYSSIQEPGKHTGILMTHSRMHSEEQALRSLVFLALLETYLCQLTGIRGLLIDGDC